MSLKQLKMDYREREMNNFAKQTMLVAVIVLGLAGCNSKSKIDPEAGGGGLSGTWVSGDNVFSAEMRDGSFISRANDTGEVLSQGSYIVLSASQVKLNWVGNLSKQSNSADCQRSDAVNMSCTDQSGKNFTLRKTG